LLVVLAGLGLALRPDPPRRDVLDASAPPAPDQEAPIADGGPVVSEADCAGAAYLCEGLVAQRHGRVLRWPDGMLELRVRVLIPDDEEPERALALQRAAMRGIRAWQGQPLPLRIEYDERPGPPHVTVTWARTLGAEELGRVRTRWREAGGPSSFSVDSFVLATRNPLDHDTPMEPHQVELAAAHEMGHALGLPHSDDPHDLMYRSNTATRLSVDDYRAVEALYRFPAGAHLPAIVR
jgi:hypothetical protein